MKKSITLLFFICACCSVFGASISDVQTIDGAQRQKIQDAIDGATNGITSVISINAITNVATLNGDSAALNFGVSNNIVFFKPVIPGSNTYIQDNGTNFIIGVTNVQINGVTRKLPSTAINQYQTNSSKTSFYSAIFTVNGATSGRPILEVRTSSQEILGRIAHPSIASTNDYTLSGIILQPSEVFVLTNLSTGSGTSITLITNMLTEVNIN